MKKYIVNDQEYELIKNYRDGFELNEVVKIFTDYFDDYDYILGDWAYGKLSLKGFCEINNKKFRPLNDIQRLDDYLKNNCAYDCKHFVLKKIS